ncbi:MAG: hypothetical protein GXP47_00965 [Acidobacteria bacterium]|nr:hypothetical protein [Acidobacteriota bacterium]
MSWKKIRARAIVATGGLAVLAGLALVTVYIVEAIVARLGQPDQSLLFWYLPFALLGIGAIAVGSGLGIWGIHELRKGRTGPPGSE